MRRTNALVLAVALLAIALLGAWLWTFASADAPHELDPPWSEAAAKEAEAAPPRATLEDGGDEPSVVLEPEARADEPARAELAVAPVSSTVVPAGPRARVRGRLVDEATNEPLPRFLLRVHDRTHQEDVWTDADGRFESRTEFGAGRLRIDPLDHPERRRPAPSLQVDHEVEGTSAQELALAVPSGPTFTLNLTPNGVLVLAPKEVGTEGEGSASTDMAASTSSTAKSEAAPANEKSATSSDDKTPRNGAAVATEPKAAASEPKPASTESSSPADARPVAVDSLHVVDAPDANPLTLETARFYLAVAGEDDRDRVGGEAARAPDPSDAGGLPWVRFGPVDPRFDHAERVELRSADGVWRGDANVGAVRGVQGTVTLKADAFGSVLGTVVDADGIGVSRAQVVLREGLGGQRERKRDAATDAHGRFRFDFVRPGECRLTARSLRHAENERTFTLTQRATAELVVVLQPKPPVGNIRGTIATETGRSTPRARVTLVAVNDRGGPSLASEVQWTTVEGRKVGVFQFTSLPAGPFTLNVEKDDWLKWEPRSLEVAAPNEDVRILVRDDVATSDYVVRVTDRDNGVALDGVRAWIEFKNGPSRERRFASGEVIERGVPLDRAFRWRIDRPGYGSERGDETAFAVEEHVDGKIRRVLELALEPGWKDVVRAVRRDGRGVIEGVEVFADGRSMGKTGKDGTLKVELRDPPKKVEAKHPNWRLAGGVDLRPAWKRDDRKFVVLRFNPVQRKK